MSEVSALLINKALDGLSVRMQAIAANIANAQTRNYRPMRVSFEDSLRIAAQNGIDEIQKVSPLLTQAASSETSGGVRLDQEMAMAAGTGARYAALVDVLNRQLSLARLATGGQQ